VKDALEPIVVQQLEDLGFELADLKLRGTKGRPVLEVRIDRADLRPVTVDDCAVASRAIEAAVDASNTLGDRYVLEVSSAGIERPLRKPSEWERFAGRRASVVADALGGRAEVEIVGIERPADAPGDEVVVVRDTKDQERRIPLADVREARLVFHWQR
jgi:ribosome maturation factor RimP